MHPILFKRDSKGKVRQWQVWSNMDKVVVEHGLAEGKKQLKHTIAKPKNVGRANETTAIEQAALEAQSKWNKQVEREDYHEDVDLAGLQLRPTLALNYLEVPHRVHWEKVVVQRKLDGLRLKAGKRKLDSVEFELITRKGETYQIPHFEEPSKRLTRIINDACGNTLNSLDGEAYIHGMPLNRITSLARKYQAGKTEQLEYHLFDLDLPEKTFNERYKLLETCLNVYQGMFGDSPFELVEAFPVRSEELAEEYQGLFMGEGYEGVIIRHTDGMYKKGRSSDLFKWKVFMDDECLITDMWMDLNGNAMLTVKQKNGKMCDVTPKRTFDFRKQMLQEKDKWIGKWINVKFQNYTEYEIMSFPNGMDLRECDENGEPLV